MNDSLALATAIKEVTESMIANDKSILDLCKVMAEKIQSMEQRILELEQVVRLLDRDIHTAGH